MKKLMLAFIVGVVMAFPEVVCSQNKESIDSLKLQVATKDVEIAQLKMQLLNSQAFASLVQTSEYVKAQQDMNRAQVTLNEARKAVEPKEKHSDEVQPALKKEK